MSKRGRLNESFKYTQQNQNETCGDNSVNCSEKDKQRNVFDEDIKGEQKGLERRIWTRDCSAASFKYKIKKKKI